MAVEDAIMFAFVATSGLLAYYAFKFRESTEPFWQNASIALFFMSLIFLNLTMNAALLMVQNNALTYLEDSVVTQGLFIMTWLTMILVLFFLGFTLFMIIRYAFQKLLSNGKGSAKYE